MNKDDWNWAPDDLRGLFMHIEGKFCIQCPRCSKFRATQGVGDIRKKYESGVEVRFCRRCTAANAVGYRQLTREEEKKIDVILDFPQYFKKNGQLWVPKFCQFCGKWPPTRVSTLLSAVKAGRKMKPGCKGCRMNGLSLTSSGYVLQMKKDHPFATKQGYVYQHRLVMEEKLGRFLTNEETVHHINGKRADNRPENLQLRKGNHGAGQVYQCGDCQSHNVIAVAIAD